MPSQQNGKPEGWPLPALSRRGCAAFWYSDDVFSHVDIFCCSWSSLSTQ